jgi:hypothetical protein
MLAFSAKKPRNRQSANGSESARLASAGLTKSGPVGRVAVEQHQFFRPQRETQAGAALPMFVRPLTAKPATRIGVITPFGAITAIRGEKI